MSELINTPKSPVETVVVTLDYTQALGAGEVLAGIVSISAIVSAGVDAGISLVLGSPIISAGSLVMVPVSGGLDSVNYSIQVLCTTNASQTLQATAILKVRNQ